MMGPILTIGFEEGENGRNWRVVNDGVMGGLSQGKATATEEGVRFKGSISLKNNGGFASFRAPYAERDLSAYSQIRMKVRGKGISFAFTLETAQQFYLPNFKHPIEVSGEDWQEIILPLKDFKAYQLGRPLGYGLEKSDLEEIIRIGIISDEKREGPFEIELASIIFE